MINIWISRPRLGGWNLGDDLGVERQLRNIIPEGRVAHGDPDTSIGQTPVNALGHGQNRIVACARNRISCALVDDEVVFLGRYIGNSTEMCCIGSDILHSHIAKGGLLDVPASLNRQRLIVNISNVGKATRPEVCLQVTRAESQMKDIGIRTGQLVEKSIENGHERRRRDKPFKGRFRLETLMPVALLVKVGHWRCQLKPASKTVMEISSVSDFLFLFVRTWSTNNSWDELPS